MKTQPPLTPAQRLRRKQDLLLASSLARQQAMLAIYQISQRADRVMGIYRQVQAWMAVPQVGAGASLAASLAALLALRKVRTFKLLRWGQLGWRVWRLAAGLLPGGRSTH